MKYTRIDIIKKIPSDKLIVIIAFFLVIPLVSVLMGNIFVKILMPNYKTTQIVKSDTEIISESNKSIMFYLQAGAFSNKSNADALKISLNNNGISPFVVEDNKLFRVIIDISNEKEYLIKLKDMLYTKSFNCLINEFEAIFLSSDKNKNIYDLMLTAQDIVGNQLSLKSTSLSEVEKFTDKVDAFNKQYEKIPISHKTEPLIAFNEKFGVLINNFIKSINESNASLAKEFIFKEMTLIITFSKEYNTNL